MDELVKQLNEDYEVLKDLEEPLVFDYYQWNVSSNKIQPGLNIQFVYFQIFLKNLLQIPLNDLDQTEFLQLIQTEYKTNRKESSNVKEFQRSYSSTDALSWFLSKSFFPKILRGIFSRRDYSLMFLSRSYLLDLSNQLKTYQSKECIRVYRSEMISKDQLRSFQDNLNQFVSINSFLLARTDNDKVRTVFNRFSNSSESKQVIFQINADPKMISNNFFAVINNDGETLVIFMIGSIFRIENMSCDDDRLWIIEISLINDQDHNLQQSFRLVQNQIEQTKFPLQNLGKICLKLNQFQLAGKCFHRLLNTSSPSVSLYKDLRELAFLEGNHQLMIQWESQLNHSIIPERKIVKSKWMKDGITIAQQGLIHPYGITIDDDQQMMYIAQWGKNRITRWGFNSNCGESFIEGLNKPTDLIFDRRTNSLIICDYGNERVVKHSLENSSNLQTIIHDIHCFGIDMDIHGNIYISDWKNNQIKRFNSEDPNGKIVAGGNGEGNGLDQLNCPTYIYVDHQSSIYISDCDNQRVIKWNKDAKQGSIIVDRSNLDELFHPQGLIGDEEGSIYIGDCSNNRIIRWSSRTKQTDLILGGNGEGTDANQFNSLRGLTLDQHGYLYAVDSNNHRIQKFILDLN